MQEWSVLYRAQDIIERDSLMSRLRNAGVKALTPEVSSFVNLNQNAPRIRMGEIDSIYEGYEIRVPVEDLEAARQVLAEFFQQSRLTLVNEQSQNFNRFYKMSAMFIFIPFLPSLFGFYFLARGLYFKEKLSTIKMLVCIVLLLLNFISGLALLLPQLRN